MARSEALRDQLRPKSFDQVIGNAGAIETLKQMLDRKSDEGLIFHGPIGTGKTSLALIVARQIVPNQTPFDFIHHLNSSQYSGIDFARDILKVSEFVSTRIYIFDEAHRMSDQMQEALLNNIESERSHSIYFFCTSELNKLLPALRRRCRKVELKPLSPDERRELILRGWGWLGRWHEEAPEEFIAEVQRTGLGIPALILNALDAYNDGTPAKEAVAAALADMEPRNAEGKLSKEERDTRIIEMQRAGRSVRDIAKQLDCSPGTVQKVLKESRQ